jgi:hypothetical protein
MSDELVRLVEGERRGTDALASMSVVMFTSAAILLSRFISPLGYAFFAITGLSVVSWLKKRRALRKLLHRRNEIEAVDRIKWLGRPALRIVFVDGASLTLPTWNHDRERVLSLLGKRELPPARLLR